MDGYKVEPIKSGGGSRHVAMSGNILYLVEGEIALILAANQVTCVWLFPPA